MIELSKELVKIWSKPLRDHASVPFYIEVDCPSCGKTLVNCKLEFSQIYNNEIFQARAVCVACRKPAHLFMVNWEPAGDPDSMNARLFIAPSPGINLDLPSDVDFQIVSPRFIEIYRQAEQAAQLGLMELVGMGYRKALEFLIKDYLIAEQPATQIAVEKATLGQCIDNYVQDPRIQKAAKHASWLGNDETHYQRRNATGDLDDLKQLMKLTMHWIAMERMTKGL